MTLRKKPAAVLGWARRTTTDKELLSWYKIARRG